MLENWKYFGVFLDADESERVYNIVNSLPGVDIPSDWRKYADHMTIIYNNKSEIAQAWAKATAPRVGEDVLLKATHVGVSDKAIAIHVNGEMSANAIPHITIACSPTGKPVDSNKITNWREIVPFTISGKIDVLQAK